MNILVVSPSFPTSKTVDFVFVDQLCQAFANLGHNVTIIAPQSLTKCLLRSVPLSKKHSFYSTAEGKQIELFRPYSITLGNTKSKLFKHSFDDAVRRAFRRLRIKPDVCYGHFWKAIFALYPIAKDNNIPLFGASGEEDVARYVHKIKEEKDSLQKYISGLVCVSSKNQQECLSLNLIAKDKSEVIPNAVDLSLFTKLDKKQCRETLGININDFVVAFVGQFVKRKGLSVLDKALQELGDESIKALYIGSGEIDPQYKGTFYKGFVRHSDLPLYLNAADVFVLPTKNEGCCNAIIEAMACGLPVISTDAEFNHDILNESNSILINVGEENLRAAILKIKDDLDYRLSLGNNAYSSAQNLSIQRRAGRIIDFMKYKMNYDN